MRIEIDIEVELPVLRNFLFCLPMRTGLLAWASIQMMLNIGYIVYIGVRNINTADYYYNYDWISKTIVYIIIIVWTILEIIACGSLFYGVQRRNGNFIEICYQYLRMKVPAYAAAIVACLIYRSADPYSCGVWFNRNIDSVMSFIFYDTPTCGVFVWVIQLYLLLLVNSMLEGLGHENDISTLCKRVKLSCNENPLFDTESMLEESNKEVEAKLITANESKQEIEEDKVTALIDGSENKQNSEEKPHTVPSNESKNTQDTKREEKV